MTSICSALGDNTKQASFDFSISYIHFILLHNVH